MPIWLQWVMSGILVVCGLLGVLGLIAKGEKPKGSTLFSSLFNIGTFALGIIGLVYLIGGGK